MRKPTIYLETTIFNFYFADDAQEKRADTLKLFQEVANGDYLAVTSSVTIGELSKATEPKRSKMMQLLTKYKVSVIDEDSDSRKLPKAYVAEKMIPENYFDDARHIAIASIYGVDLIISWNFQHIVKWKTKIQTNAINIREGYKPTDIYSPSEVISDDKSS